MNLRCKCSRGFTRVLNKITGANAGGPRLLKIRALRAARIAQFCRSAKYV
jgi:hypothetical protein